MFQAIFFSLCELEISIHRCFSWFWKATAIFWQKNIALSKYCNSALSFYGNIACENRPSDEGLFENRNRKKKIQRVIIIFINIFHSFPSKFCFLFSQRLFPPRTFLAVNPILFIVQRIKSLHSVDTFVSFSALKTNSYMIWNLLSNSITETKNPAT